MFLDRMMHYAFIMGVDITEVISLSLLFLGSVERYSDGGDQLYESAELSCNLPLIGRETGGLQGSQRSSISQISDQLRTHCVSSYSCAKIQA